MNQLKALEIVLLRAVLCLSVLCAFVSCKGSLDKRQYSSNELKLELKLENDSSGQIQSLINFSVSPGWHIYSSLPQKNGRPTAITLSADSVAVENLAWPSPLSFDEGISGISEGYAGEFSVKAQLARKPEKLETLVSWVACREVCVPGEANLVY